MCKIEVSGEVVTAYLSGEIDHHTASSMRETIDSQIETNSPRMLILDFRDVSFMDSSGVGLVMGRHRQMQSRGGETHITGAPKHIEKVMKLAGMDKIAVMDRH